MSVPLYNRDLSWLSFNYRVLLMAADPQVPLYERIKFLSIFSSNLDEFFRVRMPTIQAIHKVLEKDPGAGGDETLTTGTLQEVLQEINRQQQEYGQIFTGKILPALLEQQIQLYFNQPLEAAHTAFSKDYFLTTILGWLQPVWLTGEPKKLFLENNALYLAITLIPDNNPVVQEQVILNIPAALPRFLQLPSLNGRHYIAFLDDIIRAHLPYLFPGYQIYSAYSVKLTRNAEMDMDEMKGDILEEVETLVRKRELGIPTRFLYDAAIPLPLLHFLAHQFEVETHELVAGGRYHNLKDLADLPVPGDIPQASYPRIAPAVNPAAGHTDRLLDHIQQQDMLIHLPYQQYDPILRFFNEAATDTSVQEIYVTLYRIASGSRIAQALISAARNGKQVTVFVELKARFDEANNVRWARKMKDAGVKLIYSIPGMKVHAKTALVKRKRGYQWDYSGLIATGNFNESTARFYTDHVLFTAHTGITREMELLFIYLQSRSQPDAYNFLRFEHLLVAQFNMIDRFTALIDREIAHAQAGRPAHITIKLNNLQEKEMIAKLYEASQAGVQIDLIIRSINCLVPDIPESSGIRITRIVDRYLEHARVFIFHNNGTAEVYMGSADWMNRNLHRRIEVCVPVYDPVLQQQLKDIIALQLQDSHLAQKAIQSYVQNIV
ncbi:polyphosphate kinase 1 [Chitinophaga nivalis]|uniref:Polyphosphate kinase n=1 Tax=Chitinophaga nivalis TaxID=2991709 RepID=A0ABT3IWY1_9BACT|nr:polyphosphate kinase 1 [Chitinophaga nivalis]MCW3461827.1 polyphosphate kinase 1 [Chitinophaga nivalis]MCW3488479.1 polyphosphate kinase 1 [Chitinophaga nivalis]